jgi:hypothetical protein
MLWIAALKFIDSWRFLFWNDSFVNLLSSFHFLTWLFVMGSLFSSKLKALQFLHYFHFILQHEFSTERIFISNSSIRNCYISLMNWLSSCSWHDYELIFFLIRSNQNLFFEWSFIVKWKFGNVWGNEWRKCLKYLDNVCQLELRELIMADEYIPLNHTPDESCWREVWNVVRC